jgi:hypothetical protein
VCLDASALAKTSFSLKRKFSLIELLDLCSITEQLVLRDAIILTRSVYQVPQPMLEQITPWLNSDAILIAPSNPKPIKVSEAPNTPIFTSHPDVANHEKTTQQDAYRESGRLLGAQEAFKRSAMPLIRNFKTYDTLTKPKFSQLAFDHVARYQDDVDDLQKLLQELNKGIPNYVHMNFPPIALKILREAKSFDDIIKLSLQYRVAYSGLRKKMSEFEEMFRDPSIPPIKKMKEKQKWINAWNENQKDFRDQYMVLANGLVGILADGVDMFGNATSGNYVASSISGAGIALKGYKNIRSIIERNESWALSPIRSAFIDSLSTSHSEIKYIVERLFNYDPKSFDELMKVSFLGENNTLENLVDNEMKIRLSKN